MTHYVCTGGCGGVSDTPGVCNAESCSLHGQPLKECNCTDGLHKEAFDSAHGTNDAAE
ncbi:MAG: hypothetical protein P4L74_02655 [Candidatus Doudnabacteria bacterium]|nr:hypothetical protein [Candidatus Doudnabacteria bacterium]